MNSSVLLKTAGLDLGAAYFIFPTSPA